MSNHFYNRWVEALKSGNYQKGTGYLRRGDSFCCLGIACTILSNESLHISTNPLDPQIYHYNAHHKSLPFVIQQMLGLRTQMGHFRLDELSAPTLEKIGALLPHHAWHTEVKLAAINDATNDFDLIIQILEEQPPSLFTQKEQ